MRRVLKMRKFLSVHSLTAVLFLLGFFAIGSQVNAATLYGVTTGNSLIRFDSSTPGTVATVGAITGLQGGENVLGIDFRPATGQLFALGSNSRLYTINKATGAATFVATLSTALSGTNFGFDFNPTVDRIRIVSDTGQNLRVNPANGAAIVDGVLNPGTPQVTAAAYTNSFSGSTTTTLFDIDTNTDQLFTQNPPNNGTLVLVGSLGVNATAVNGFDISTADNTAYAALTVALTSLYTINTTTGAATSVGLIGTGASLNGLAADIGTSASNLTVYGLTTANQLVSFNSSRPNTILRTVAITGLAGGENLLGIDFRPATGQLFGLGSTSRLYTINTTTGAATAVGSAGAFTLSGTDFGFDFNPTVDRIRVVSNTGQNLRLNPNDGTLTMTDGPLNPGTPQVTAAAYTNSFAGATTTTLYDIDSGTDALYTQNPPNAGTLNLVGPLGINIDASNGFDIANGSGVALAGVQLAGGTTSQLYSINLTTGAASFIGPIGAATSLRGLAIAGGSAATRTVDFDGDGRTDYAVFRPSNNTWYVRRSSGGDISFQFGNSSTDFLTPGDYDGDGRTDFAVWRDTTGVFYYLQSSDNSIQTFQFGISGDEPVARDYDGDGKTDFAVVRRSGNLMTWYIRNSSNGSIRIEQFGLNTDFTAPGDYDGDGRFDLAVQRGNTNEAANFYVQGSFSGFMTRQWGLGGDLVVPGDYDGDGKTDYSILRAGAPYNWYIQPNQSSSSFIGVQWGTKPHYSVQGDYDGDGKTDVAVWDPISGQFYVLRTAGGVIQVQFGQNGDYPVANFDTH